MEKEFRNKIIFYVIKVVLFLIWILWTVIFPLFIDTTLFIEGYLGSLPILNPFFGITIALACILLYYLFKELREIIKEQKKDAN